CHLSGSQPSAIPFIHAANPDAAVTANAPDRPVTTPHGYLTRLFLKGVERHRYRAISTVPA
ncbi:MAG: hypothetical protein PVTTEEND_000797, partial [Candidatus Fervidibacter sp.]